MVERLEKWLNQGREQMGEVLIVKTSSGYALMHFLDALTLNPTIHYDPEDAIELGKYDEQGNYRPLRSAPSLKCGWRLELTTLQQVVQALDYFYPAMLGTYRAFEDQKGCPVPLRETLNRQTGMYRVTQKISDADAATVVARVCAPEQCMKTITWPISIGSTDNHDLNESNKRVIPLPCEESCNILVAAIREFVKKSTP